MVSSLNNKNAPVILEIGEQHLRIGFGGEKEPRCILSSDIFKNARKLSLLRKDIIHNQIKLRTQNVDVVQFPGEVEGDTTSIFKDKNKSQGQAQNTKDKDLKRKKQFSNLEIDLHWLDDPMNKNSHGSNLDPAEIEELEDDRSISSETKKNENMGQKSKDNICKKETTLNASYYDCYMDDVVNLIDTLAPCIQDIFFRSLKCDPKGRKILIIEASSLVGDIYIREALTFILFEYLKISTIHCLPSTSLAIHTAGVQSGIIVDMGYENINIMAVIDGKVLTNTYISLPERGLKFIVLFLKNLINVRSSTTQVDKQAENGRNYHKVNSKYEIQISSVECSEILNGIGLLCKNHQGVQYIPNRMSPFIRCLKDNPKTESDSSKNHEDDTKFPEQNQTQGINFKSEMPTKFKKKKSRNVINKTRALDVDLSWLAIDDNLEEPSTKPTIEELNTIQLNERDKATIHHHNATHPDSNQKDDINGDAKEKKIKNESNVIDSTVYAYENSTYIETEDIFQAIEILFEDIFSPIKGEENPRGQQYKSRLTSSSNFYESYYSYKDTNLQSAIYACIAKCPRDYRLSLSKSLIFTGVLANIPGLISEIITRMNKEANQFQNRDIQNIEENKRATPIHFASLPLICRHDLANWCGGSIYSTVFDIAIVNCQLLTREEYHFKNANYENNSIKHRNGNNNNMELHFKDTRTYLRTHNIVSSKESFYDCFSFNTNAIFSDIPASGRLEQSN